MSQEVEIEQVEEVTDELIEAWGKLLGQLSRSAAPLTAKDLVAVVDSDSTTMLVARFGGEIIGSLTLAVFAIPTGVRAWIEDVVVDESARGKGVGEQLTRSALDLALQCGARSVDLTSRPTREAANRLYRRVGFQQRETNVYRFTFDS